MKSPFQWLHVFYCERRLAAALIDKRYWEDEAERVALNNGVARTRIEIWRKRLHNARYPVDGTASKLGVVR